MQFRGRGCSRTGGDYRFLKVTVDCHGIWERFAAVGSSFPDGALVDLAKVCWARGASVGLE